MYQNAKPILQSFDLVNDRDRHVHFVLLRTTKLRPALISDIVQKLKPQFRFLDLRLSGFWL